MKAGMILITNIDEINEVTAANNALGYKATTIPEKQLKSYDLLFDIEDVKLSYMNLENNIVIMLHDEYFELEFNDIVWSKLQAKFNDTSQQ